MTTLPRPSNLPVTSRENLPTMYDLPSEHIEEFVLPDQFHALEAILLMLTFMPPNWSPDLVFSMMDLYVYYDLDHPQWYKRPDWFGAVGVPSLAEGREPRLSYVMWQEKVSPFVVVELLSPGTEDEDLGRTTRQRGKPPTKWEVYEKILQVPYYVTFGRRYNDKFQAFRLQGDRYESVDVSSGSLIMPEIQLSLGLWQGSFRGIDREWLRWMTLDGNLILTPEEEAEAAKQRANAAEQQATDAEQRANAAQQQATDVERENDRLKARLRELGMDPDELS